jgi:N-acetylneuraminate synthase
MNESHIYIIAEAGVNHNGEREKAFALVEVAAAAGADAVKFQTFNAERLATLHAPKAAYQKRTTEAGENQLAMLKKLELPLAWHSELQAYAKTKDIEFLSTAFDRESLAFLESLDLPLYKIPSGEITNGPLLWAFARTAKRLILSTGMATLGEVEQALAVLAHGMVFDTPPHSLNEVWRHWSLSSARALVAERVTLLHCTSQYPTPMDEVNLRALDTLSKAFALPVGYSDHTEGTLIPAAAVARGAKVIEKHFTLDRNLPGPDHKASLEPDELTRMVADIRSLELALGGGGKYPQPSEWDTRKAARQNVVAARPLKAGQILQAADLATARAGDGPLAIQLWDLVGTRAAADRAPGESL